MVKESSYVGNNEFWTSLDDLLKSSKLIIDRKKGSVHPKYDSCIYPLDYGYLENTTSMDGGGIDVWSGSSECGLDAIFITVDTLKKDSEIKLLLNCSEDEKQIVYDFHNGRYMRGTLVRR